MMEQIVRVREVRPDGMATVIHFRQSACSGDCHRCSGCGAAQEAIELSAKNPIGAAPGALVTVTSETGPVLKAAMVLYLAPLLLFFLGYLLGAALWARGALTGCAGFALGIGLAVVYDRKIVKKQKNEYIITGYAGESLLKAERKGDNGLD